MPRHAFDLGRRSAERAREQQPSKQNTQAERGDRDEDARVLKKSIETFYGSRFAGQFDTAVQGPTVSVSKKAGGSALKIEVLPMAKFKLSGGSGPGGFGADLAVTMSEASEEEMMDALEDWFNISPA